MSRNILAKNCIHVVICFESTNVPKTYDIINDSFVCKKQHCKLNFNYLFPCIFTFLLYISKKLLPNWIIIDLEYDKFMWDIIKNSLKYHFLHTKWMIKYVL